MAIGKLKKMMDADLATAANDWQTFQLKQMEKANGEKEVECPYLPNQTLIKKSVN